MKKKLLQLKSEYDHAKRRVTEEKQALQTARKHVEHCLAAQLLVQEVSTFCQEKAHAQIASVVTRCLRTVGYDYDFKILFEKKRGRTEAKLCFLRGETIFEDPLDQCSGGAVQVAAFALRISCLVLSLPRKRLLLVLDEPFKDVHGVKYQHTIGDMLLNLAEEMNVQMIIVTDDDWLKIGNVKEL